MNGSYRFVYLEHKEKEFLQKLSNFPLRGHPRAVPQAPLFQSSYQLGTNMPHRVGCEALEGFLGSTNQERPRYETANRCHFPD